MTAFDCLEGVTHETLGVAEGPTSACRVMGADIYLDHFRTEHR